MERKDNARICTGIMNGDRFKTVLFIALIAGLCILVAGISGKLVMEKITEKLITANYIDLMNETAPEVGNVLNHGIGNVALRLITALVKNDSSGFVNAVKDAYRTIASLTEYSGTPGMVLNSFFEEAAWEAFQKTRSLLIESVGVYMPILQFAAWCSDLLVLGGIIAGVSLILFYLSGGKFKEVKVAKASCAIGTVWTIAVIVMSTIVMNGLNNGFAESQIAASSTSAISSCSHEHVALINWSDSTCRSKGYTGDEYCEDCQTILNTGEIIPFSEHQYENGVCYYCGWNIPGLYVNDNLEYTWDQLISNSYITINDNHLDKVLETLPGRLVVKDGIALNRGVFYQSGLDEVWLPRTYTKIGENAFFGSNIASFVFFGAIEQIGEQAFENTKIEQIVIPEGIETIPDGCFSGCEYLQRVSLPDTVETIGRYAFADCKMLNEIELPNSIKTIGENCFSDSGLESFFAPPSLEEIGRACFFGCESLRTIDLGKCAVEKLNSNTFAYCRNIMNLTLPNHLISLDSVFNMSSHVEYLILPDTVRNVYLGGNSYYPLESLKWVVWPAGLTDASGFESAANLDTVYFRGSEFEWGLVTGKKYDVPFNTQDVDIFENTTIIYNATESDWTYRVAEGQETAIKQDNSGQSALYNKDQEMSDDQNDPVIVSTELSEIDNPENEKKEETVQTIDDYTFNVDHGEAIITDYTGEESELFIPDILGGYMVVGIADGAFRDRSFLTRVYFPNAFKSIGNYAFCNCSNLNYVSVPDSIETVGNDAFVGCPKLIISCSTDIYKNVFCSINGDIIFETEYYGP